MGLPKPVRLALALLACAAGVYAVVYAIFGASWFKMSDSELARLEGCYSVSGQQLFKLSDRTILTSTGAFGLDGAHEKGGDVLMVDGPVRVMRRPHLMLVREGTSSKVPIAYGKPVRLELWDENDEPVEANQTQCP